MPNISINDWTPVNGVEFRLQDNKLILKDSEILDWHLIRYRDKSVMYKRVTLKVEYEPLPACDTHFYVNGWGGVDLAVVNSDGMIIKSKAIESNVTRSDDIFSLTLVYNSSHPSISIGMVKYKERFCGAGREQFAIHHVSYEAEPLRQEGDREHCLRLVDVGAAGGLQANWLPHLDLLDVTMIEPSHSEAARLRKIFPGFRVIESALFDQAGPQILKVTKFPECSSLLEPNTAELGQYRAAPLFDVVNRVQIECERYDAIHANGLAPAPDVLKIDVQGVEYEVLQGFGKLLADCIAIELESHFYEVYKGQKLFGEIIAYLATFDLRLRRMDPQLSFDADMVEVNAFFTKPRALLSPERTAKLDLVEKVWKLTVSDSVLTALKKFER